MALEQIKHGPLTTHSPPFSPAGGTSYNCDLQGTIGDGGVELMQLVNGQPFPLNPPVRFSASEVNGGKLTGFIPTGTVLQWRVPSPVNNVSVKITANHS
jgi:hypothetical protein